VFVHAADRAFVAATLFLVAAIVLVQRGGTRAPGWAAARHQERAVQPADELDGRELAVAEA